MCAVGAHLLEKSAVIEKGEAMDLMEHVRRPMVDDVRMLVVNSQCEPIDGGTMCVTPFHLIFSTRKQKEDELTILHTSIDHIEYKASSTSAVVCLKDFRRISFEYKTPEDCQDMVDALEVLSKPLRLNQLYALSAVSKRYTDRKLPEDQIVHSPLEDVFAMWQCSPEKFRISYANTNFVLCASYPKASIVPKTVTDEDLKKIAAFRHMGRFPIVCYHHSRTQAVLVRCGQPLCGPNQKRCREDANLLNACLPSLSKGKVVDIRSQSVAQQHMSKGGGVELPSHYPQWKLEYIKTDTPSALQSSLNKLIEACFDSSLSSSSSWFGRLEASGWLRHVAKLLNAAKSVVQALHQDANSVVVHGSGSRDATLQLTSLAQVLLDSRSRTMQGFMQLIQREWLDGGHPFSIRHNHVTSAPEKEKAPIFLLFLDAVWQVMQQFPLSFEFNERFLHTLFVHSYSSAYGNFLYDTPRERARNKLSEKSSSLWAHLLQSEVADPMRNPLYEKSSSVLHITVTALNITLWKQLYLRTDAETTLSISGFEAIKQLKDTNTALKSTLETVRNELEQLQVEGRKYASNWT